MATFIILTALKFVCNAITSHSKTLQRSNDCFPTVTDAASAAFRVANTYFMRFSAFPINIVSA